MLASYSGGDNSHCSTKNFNINRNLLYDSFYFTSFTTLIKWNRFSVYDTKVYKLFFILFFSFIYKAPCVVLVAMHGNWLSLLQVCCFLANNKTHFSQQALLTFLTLPFVNWQDSLWKLPLVNFAQTTKLFRSQET